ncbi:DUF453-domain-containing protein [Teratosphaeria nubilosa]|uniref:DUF453-domain-containing protein n=1 Tax=Teratosphaeria nubilosa TaxID=161662 RepID=A0A6G1LI80_9PEZI|nr:DUF453-domain-containing protein [Teratosphaeria nubilosa]
MATRSLLATFMRGGTSNGLMIHRRDLPQNEKHWQSILSSAMGSPDSYGRQLDGMGSGVSSTSKICVICKSERDDADVEFTFVQVGIKDGLLDLAGTCGNMSSAVGPFALNEGLVPHVKPAEDDDEALVRIFNTNTSKIIHSRFKTARGRYEPSGDYSIDGVPGKQSCITLSFLDPAGAKTGKALPTGNSVDSLYLPDGSTINASLIDIANPGVFVLAADLGVPGDVAPDVLGADLALMKRLESIRQAGASKMGLDPATQTVPKFVLIAGPDSSARDMHIRCRALSMQQAHKAVPLTLALNLGAACNLEGTLPYLTAVGAAGKQSVIIEHASGKLEVGSVVKEGRIESALLHRTARFLMKGEVFYSVPE